jgi:hypothetical protein
MFCPADQLDQFPVRAVKADLQQSVLSHFDQLFLQLGADLLHDLLDARRMDAPVGDEALQRDARHFAAEGVERGEDHRLGGVINDHIHAGGSFEGADVPPLPADDPAFHLVTLNVQDADGGFDRMVGGRALDGLDDELLGFLLRLVPGFFADLLQHQRRFGLHLVRQVLHEHPLCFIARESGGPFEPLVLFREQAVQLGLPGVQLPSPLFEVTAQLHLFALLLSQQLHLAVDILLARFQRLFLRGQLVALGLDIVVKVPLLLIPLIFDFQQLLALQRVCLLLPIFHDLPRGFLG